VGCGLSEGEYISLCKHKIDDVKVTVEYLRNCGKVSQIGLWGKSMGAATTILFSPMERKISCLVLDSPYGSLKELALKLA